MFLQFFHALVHDILRGAHRYIKFLRQRLEKYAVKQSSLDNGSISPAIRISDNDEIDHTLDVLAVQVGDVRHFFLPSLLLFLFSSLTRPVPLHLSHFE